jgi:hypothetical protein
MALLQWTWCLLVIVELPMIGSVVTTLSDGHHPHALRQVLGAWASRSSRTNAGSRPSASASATASIGRP